MSYTGDYKDGLRDGHGSYVFPGGSFTYTGEWKRGKMYGRGVYTICNGGSYEGEFIDGEIEGIGLRRWPDGATYNGQFHRGVRQGEGVMISADGEVYEGHWEENQRSGLGELRKPNQDVYRGDFYRHYPHGKGRIEFGHNGFVYDGDWVEGKICGRGVLRDAGGSDVYEGEWLNGLRHGNGVGVLTPSTNLSSSPILFEGVWMNDKPLAPTTALAFKLIRQTTEQANESEASRTVVEYQEPPATIVVEKKQASKLPPLGVVCVSESPLNSDVTTVVGESGRQFRLRVFESNTTPPPVARSGSQADLSVIAIEPVEPSQWRFVLVEDRPVKIDSEVNPESETEEAVPEETVRDEVVVVNASGVAVFDGFALPSASLIGTYELVCESCNGEDTLAPVRLLVQLVE